MLKRRHRKNEQIEGVIDLERLRSGSPECLEKSPELFFSLTYPTHDLRIFVQAMSRRFGGGARSGGDGVVIAEAVKGFGKSHALLTAYHLFANPDPAKRWMSSLKLPWTPPPTPVVMVEKFTDQYLPFDSLWSLLDQHLKAGWDRAHPPSLPELKQALEGRHLVLIMDELERGIGNIADPARKSQNLSFLQMLSEEANRGLNITLVAAIYSGAEEPGLTLRRVPRVELRFRNPEDRASVVRHRLFADAETYSKVDAETIVRSYLNAWKQLGVRATDEYEARCLASYPFLPELMDTVFGRMAAGDAFQGTRGALGLLAAMVDTARNEDGLLTEAHCRINDEACANRLQDFDVAGTLMNCARTNARELGQHDLALPLASATLFATLAPGGRERGLTRDELIRNVVMPGTDPNKFETCLHAFERFASNFHHPDDRYFFDPEENENAKVELELSRSGNDEEARKEIARIWGKDIFGDDRSAVVLTDADSCRVALESIPRGQPRFVLSPRRLSMQERHTLYFGVEERNQVLLLEPGEESVDHLRNSDLLVNAKRVLAARALAEQAQGSERRRKYEQIEERNRAAVREMIKGAGYVFIAVERWSERVDECRFEQESLGKSATKQEVVSRLRLDVFPPGIFQEDLQRRLKDIINLTVDQVDRMYRGTLGFPVPLSVTAVTDAVKALVEDRGRVLGLSTSRGAFCGQPVSLSDSELRQAALMDPWPAGPAAGAGRQPTPAVQPTATGQVGVAPEAPPLVVPPSAAIEECNTPICETPGALRLAVAARLAGMSLRTVQEARFRVIVSGLNVELSSLPGALRGGLTGKGHTEIQLEFLLTGPFTKAEVELQSERLPALPSATYWAGLKCEIASEIQTVGNP